LVTVIAKTNNNFCRDGEEDKSRGKTQQDPLRKKVEVEN